MRCGLGLGIGDWAGTGTSGLRSPIPSLAREIWEVTLRQPQSTPLELRAARATPLAKETPISLICLPEADSQRGILVVASSGSQGVRVRNNRLTPIAADPDATDAADATRGTYRYDPLRDVARRGETRPRRANPLRPAGIRSSSARAIAGSARRRPGLGAATSNRVTNPTAPGGTWSRIVCKAPGGSSSRLLLPRPLAQQSVQGVWLDETRVAWHGGLDPDDRRVVVPIPPGRRFAVVSIHFLTDGPPLGTFASMEPVLPEIDVPALTRTWTVWLPPGYQTAERARRDAEPPARRCPSRSGSSVRWGGTPRRSPFVFGQPRIGRGWRRGIRSRPRPGFGPSKCWSGSPPPRHRRDPRRPQAAAKPRSPPPAALPGATFCSAPPTTRSGNYWWTAGRWDGSGSPLKAGSRRRRRACRARAGQSSCSNRPTWPCSAWATSCS